MEMLMTYLKCFLVGGLLCAVGQVLIDKTNLTPARILTAYAVCNSHAETVSDLLVAEVVFIHFPYRTFFRHSESDHLVPSMVPRLSWPHAAMMSLPISRLIVALMPPDVRMSLNCFTFAGLADWKTVPGTLFAAMRFT